jgi:general secretion pathway protein F
MDTYTYEAATKEGGIVTGTVEAASEHSAVDRIQERGYYPLKIKKAGEEKAPLSTNILSFLQARIGEKDIMTFTYQLGVLLDAGFPLERALAVVSDLTDKKALRDLLHEVLSHVRSGKSFSDSLSKFPSVFPSFYVNMIKAGEAGGFLEDTIFRMAVYLENSQSLKSDVRSALIYPIILFAVGTLAVIFLLAFVVPKFTIIFSDFGAVLPLPTRILLSISNVLRTHGWLIVLLLIGAFFGLRHFLKSDAGKSFWDRLRFKLPFFGKLFKETIVARFARTMGTLLGSGVPILNALQIVKGTLESVRMSETLTSVRDDVRKGRGISEPLKKSDLFPSIAIHMVTVGEETGKLDEMLLKIAERFEIEVRNTIKRMLSLLEPALILCMAVVVGFIVIAMLLAIFSMSELPGL